MELQSIAVLDSFVLVPTINFFAFPTYRRGAWSCRNQWNRKINCIENSCSKTETQFGSL